MKSASQILDDFWGPYRDHSRSIDRTRILSLIESVQQDAQEEMDSKIEICRHLDWNLISERDAYREALENLSDGMVCECGQWQDAQDVLAKFKE